jgi:antitoxin component YwqK of YwqJK toxin-antitoxin module
MKTRLVLLFSVLLTSVVFAQTEAPNALDDQGRKHGEWVVKFPESGNTRYQGQFEHGTPVGAFFYYYETGEKSSEVQYRSDGTAHAIFFHKNGAIMGEGEYLNQLKHGVWKFYDNQTILSSIEPYVNGKISGLVKVYHLNGSVAAEVPYVNGLKNGPFKEFNTDGKVRIEGTYRDNTYDGAYKQYFDDGTPYMVGQYRAAVKDGHWIEYASDGRIKVQEVWDKGKLLKQKIEEGFEVEEIKVDLEEDDVIDEQQIIEEMYNGAVPPR